MEASDIKMITLSWRKLVEEVIEDRNRLRASNKELLEALEEIVSLSSKSGVTLEAIVKWMRWDAQAAIDRAKRGKDDAN